MHFDQNILFIIIVGIIGISRLIARILENAREQSERRKSAGGLQRNRQPRPAGLQPQQMTDEQRIREFLEALGQPAGTAPPPKAMPRTELPPRPLAPVQPPPNLRPFAPVVIRPPRPARKEVAPEQKPPARSERVKPVIAAPASAPLSVETNEPGSWIKAEEFRRAETIAARPARQLVSAAVSQELAWARLLKSPGSMRTAIVIREILGPPRGLQSFPSAELGT